MSAQMNFRTSFSGFNREDVVHYIEYLNSKHNAEINQLNSEMEYLRKQPQIPAETPPAEDQTEIIAQQAARIRELFDRCTQLEQELETAKTDKFPAAVIEVAPQPAPQPAPIKTCLEEELEAYRRAERAERYARERAELLCRQANGALSDATVKVDDAAQQVSEIADRVLAQLTELQDAVSSSKQAMRDAAATMYTIRPLGEEN